MANFTINMKRYAETRKMAMGEVVREIVMTVGALVDERSPVGNRELWAVNISRAARGLPPTPKGYVGGHFRANNQYKFGAPGTIEKEGIDPSGATAMSAIKAGVLTSPVAGLHYISNAVPYAMALENRHSSQAPSGVYSLAAIDMSNAARRIIASKFG